MEKQMVQDHTGRPETIGVALKLLYISFGITVIRSFTFVETNIIGKEPSAAVFVLFVMLSFLVIKCFCIYKTGKGRNWARIISLVFAVISTPFSVFKDLQNLTVDPIFGIFGIGQAVFVIVAFVILFQKPSNDWFRAMETI